MLSIKNNGRWALLGLGVAVLGGCDDDAPAAPVGDTATTSGAITNGDLAFHHAPIHYQDVNKKSGTGLSGVSDYLMPFNFDGDFNGRNNWDNTQNKPASVQFSVIETVSHFFIAYLLYHPRDWVAGLGQEHENDGESAIVVVRKDGSQFGVPEAMVTTFHSDWKSYRMQPYIGRGPCNPETPQDLQIELGRPRTFQEAEGHGLTGCTSATSCVRNDDGIRYEPSSSVAGLAPVPIPDGQQVTVSYTLGDMKPLLDHRWDRPVFSSPGAMAGDSSGSCGDGLSTCLDDAAVGFWAHVDSRVPNNAACSALRTAPGEDLAAFTRGFFSFGALPAPSTTYLSNTVLHQKCDTGRRLQGSSDACVQQICAQDGFCCSNAWDARCVNEVQSICGRSCVGCALNVCQVNAGPIGAGCNSLCAQQVCAADPFCCSTRWDSLCVGEVPTLCGLTCFP